MWFGGWLWRRRPTRASLQGGLRDGGSDSFWGGYRVETARLRGWDYGAAGWYFVTVCTRGRGCWLGVVVDGKVCLSRAGRIVTEELRNTEKIRPNVTLDRWIVMPDHLHAIIVIQNEVNPTNPVETSRRDVSSTHRHISSEPQLTPNSLGSIVGQFKSVCTKRIRAGGTHDFAWQPRFHDHTIRTQTALTNIQKYITQNPSRRQPPNNDPFDNAP